MPSNKKLSEVKPMPRGGPRRNKPTSLKILQGTDRPDRVNENEPKPRPVAGERPSGMDYYAKQKWDYLAPRLERLGVLTEIDGDLLEAYCRAYARFRRANLRLEKAAKSDADMDWRKLEISVEKAEHSMRLLAGEFGMSASSRSRLSVNTEQEEDAFEAFLSGNGE